MSSSMTPFTDVESNGNKSRTPASKPQKEKHLIAAVVILAIILLAFIIAVIILAVKAAKHPSSDEICATEGCLSTSLDLLHSMNTSVDPCDDFFQYACGNWHLSYSGPAQNKLGKAGLDDMVRMHEYLMGAVNDENLADNVRKVASAYHICSSYEELRDEDELWLLQTLQDVGGWPMADKNWEENRYPWERNLARSFHNLMISTPFAFTVDLNLYDTRHYILQVGQHSVEEMEPLNKEQILTIARRIGDREDDINLEKEFEKVEEFEKKLRKMTLPPEKILDNKTDAKVITIKELEIAIPWINWLEFLRTVFGPHLTTSIHESEPVMLLGFNYMSTVLGSIFEGETSKRTLANYIAASFIRDLVTVNNKMVSESLLDPPRYPFGKIIKADFPAGFSVSCLGFISKKLGPAVDYLNYRSRKFEPVAGEMLPYYFSAMKDVIATADWLDDKTRKAADDKLKSMIYFSGFPEEAKNKKLLDEFLVGFPNLTYNALSNQLSIQHYRFAKAVQNLRKSPNKNRWPLMEGTHASQINAFYTAEYNAIVIPADIQTEPIISSKRPKFWNFGGFGWVLGHEITHGFDTSGSKRDKDGNIKDWWTPPAKQEFHKRAKCVIDQYNKIPYGYENHYVDGEQTVGENVADNGGLRQTYAAYKKWEKEHGKEKLIPGFEKFSIEQLFFLSVAQVYCPNIVSPNELYEAHRVDPHSPTPFRANPALANFDQFAKAFNCKSGTPMNPVKKCVVW